MGPKGILQGLRNERRPERRRCQRSQCDAGFHASAKSPNLNILPRCRLMFNRTCNKAITCSTNTLHELVHCGCIRPKTSRNTTRAKTGTTTGIAPSMSGRRVVRKWKSIALDFVLSDRAGQGKLTDENNVIYHYNFVAGQLFFCAGRSL
jgi:hypothetical protein